MTVLFRRVKQTERGSPMEHIQPVPTRHHLSSRYIHLMNAPIMFWTA